MLIYTFSFLLSHAFSIYFANFSHIMGMCFVHQNAQKKDGSGQIYKVGSNNRIELFNF